MKSPERYIVSLVLLACVGLSLSGRAERRPDSLRRPSYLALNGTAGTVFGTNEFVQGNRRIPLYGSASVKYAFCSLGSDWKDIAYGMPYYGVGVYTAWFGRNDDLGRPFSLYLFQGATLSQLSRRVGLNYEWNLGMSANWKYYDPFDNPENVALGSSVNAHVGVNLYLKFYLSRRLDVHLGAGLTHFSNGSTRQPNHGMNMGGIFLEVAYNFNRDRVIEEFNPLAVPPRFVRRIDHDLLVNISVRQIDIDTTGTGLPSGYVDRKFNVYGLSYAAMYAPGYKYKYGLSFDLLYDESSGARMWRELNPADGNYYDRVKLAPFGKRLSLGISAKGEMVLPHYSIFANLGWNVLHGNKRDFRLYQVLGVKIYLKENLFGTFGIRATHFSQAQYLYWSLGYTIRGRKLGDRIRR